jgi:hypothetical protein
MSKKRTSLDAIVTRSVIETQAEEPSASTASRITPDAGNRPGFKQQTAYLPIAVHEQLRRLAFEERAKMHDYLLEGLDLVFRKRGLAGVEELKKKNP